MRPRAMTRVTSLLLMLAVTSVSCGGTSAARARSSRPNAQVTIYFLIDAGTAPIGVRRAISQKSPSAEAALRLLLRSPTAAERRFGVGSALPERARIQSFSIAPSVSARGGSATVDLAGFPAAKRAGALRIARVGAQIARTLIGLSGIERVWIRSDGRPWAFSNQQGKLIDRAWDYSTLVGLHKICAAKPGTEGIPGDCFQALP
jgi:spore germination protein GerM